MTSVLVVGGSGAMGSLFIGLLEDVPGVDLIAIDLVGASEPGRTRRLIGDLESISVEFAGVLASIDVVVLAVPEVVAERAATALFAAIGDRALVVDTLSVKSGWLSRLDESLANRSTHPEILSINPMFAPSLGFPGRGVAVVTLHDGPRCEWFRGLLTGWGAELIEMEPGEHDRFMASIQVATHAAVLAFGLALGDLGHDLDRLWPALTPPHRTMLSLAARICAGDAHVYHDIQHANPFASNARLALSEGLRSVASASEAEDPAVFKALLAQIGVSLGSHRSELEKRCAALFEDALFEAAQFAID